MTTPSEKLAQSLEELRRFQDRGLTAIRSADLSRIHRERLLANGFLLEVMKGWYVPSRPGVETAGESTAWNTSFWPFCAGYFRERFGESWCLSPEQSLALHAGNRSVPRQLVVRSPLANNKTAVLPHNTSLLEVRAALPEPKDIEEKEGIRLFTLGSALVACGPGFYSRNQTDARLALAMIGDASDILGRLLNGGHASIAGRLAGAFRNIGRGRIADDMLMAMRAAGYSVREFDPFDSETPPVLSTRETSPYINRIRLMWQRMRGSVVDGFPRAAGGPTDFAAYLRRVEETYVKDAYHSLSIEGYRVSQGLIERVRSGAWNPEVSDFDRDQRDALAARGYWQAFQAVSESVRRVLAGANPGAVADEDHGIWYREMLAPSVTAGLLRASDLAGYRTGPVYIRRSMHVPPYPEAVREAIPAFFDLLREEPEAAVRVVLGHFLFVYIHPYPDGNGRIGRFLMNLMLAAGGYPWTVVPVEERDTYMATLEAASTRQEIAPFTDFLARLVSQNLKDQ